MRIKNPAAESDPWMPDFEVGGTWLYRHSDSCYTVKAIEGDRIEFHNGSGHPLFLTVDEAAKMMRPT